MRWEYLVGLRYVRARRSETFVSVITLISTLGVLIGVTVMTITLSVMTGFEQDLRSRILGLQPHLRLTNRLTAGVVDDPLILAKEMASNKHVIEAAPVLNAQLILSVGDALSGVYARGVDPATHSSTFGIAGMITEGSLEGIGKFKDVAGAKLPGVVIGHALSKQLGIALGDVVTLMSPKLSASPFGVLPRSKRFYIAGIFDSGMSEYDTGLVYLSIDAARRLVGLGNVATGIEARIDDPYRAPEVAAELNKTIGMPYWVESWTEAHRNVFAALQLEKTVYFLVLLLIILVAAFAIVATLYMVVMEKRRDIGVLKAMGATNSSVAAIFVFKGALIGTLGTSLGALLGYIVCLGLARYHFIDLPKGVFYVSTLPVRIVGANFAAVCGASMAICLLATIFPAWKATKVAPVDILRYE